MSAALPFSYRDEGGDKSLLGSAIVGDGFAVSLTERHSPAVFRLGDAAAPVFAEGQLDAYRAYYTQYYAPEALLGHEAALQAGGSPAYLLAGAGPLRLQKGLPPLDTDLTAAQVAAVFGVVNLGRLCDAARGGVDAIVDLFEALLQRSLSKIVSSVTVTRGRVMTESAYLTTRGRDIGYYKGSNLYTAFQIAQSTSETISPAWTSVLNEVKAKAVPGQLTWTLWVEMDDDRTAVQEIIFSCALKRHTRYASLETYLKASYSATGGVATTPSGSTVTVPRAAIRHDTAANMWIVKGTGNAARLAVQGGQGRLRAITHSKTASWDGVWPHSLYSTTMGTTIDSQFGTFTEGSSNPSYSWDGGENIVISSGNGAGTKNAPAGSVAFSALAAERFGFTGMPISGVALNIPLASSLYPARGLVGQQVGTLLTDVPGLMVKMVLSRPVEVESLGPSMAIQPALSEVVAGLPSDVLATALSALGDHPELEGTVAELRAKPRIFWGYSSAARLVPAPGVLGRTKVARDAREAGVSINNEELIPKDDDDPASAAVTFKAASNAIEAFISESVLSKRGAIVAVQQTGASRSRPTKALYLRLVGGVLTPMWHDGTTYRADFDEDVLDEAFQYLLNGNVINLEAAATSAAKSYVSPYGVSTYPAYYDLVTDELFGRSYGSITSPANAVSDPQWTLDGQMSHGFPRHPTQWSDEFWLIYGGTKMWKAEEVVGGLVASPFGVGAFPKAT